MIKYLDDVGCACIVARGAEDAIEQLEDMV
jgi:hypothetical protein